MSESSAGRSAPQRRRRWVRIVAVVLSVLLVLWLAAAQYFAVQIESDALEIAPASLHYSVDVRNVASGTITLTAIDKDDEHEAPLLTPVVYGLLWVGGYGRVSGPVKRAGDAVTRTFRLVTGTAPAAGTHVAPDRDAYPADPATALRRPLSTVRYTSPLGTFSAWLAKPGGDASSTWAVLVHGQGASRAESLRAAAITVRAGLPSLDITYRNDADAPRDPSDYYGFGATEWPDLEGAVRYALTHGAAKVVLVGHSMGGAIVASFLLHSSLRGKVAGVVLDAPMLSLGDTIEFQADDMGVPGLLTATAEQLADWEYDLDLDRLDYLAADDWVRVPTLIFHGTGDDSVPIGTSRRLARDHPDLVRLVETTAEHVASWNTDPAGYARELSAFLTSLP